LPFIERQPFFKSSCENETLGVKAKEENINMKKLSKHAAKPFLYQGLSLFVLLGLSGCNLGSESGKEAALSISAVSAGAEMNSSGKPSGRQLEHLDRGLVAVPSDKGVLVSWRKLRSDDDNFGVDVYRNGEKISKGTIADKTNYLDVQGTGGAVYEIRAEGQVLATATAWQKPYLSIPITPPKDGVTPDGETYSYTANDASVGDLDGDGRYEIVLKWNPTNAKDNSQSGYTGNVFIDAYTLDGEQLWRIDLGKNIRAGAHYTQFMVYDFDGDGRSEIAMKTADGTTDGEGKVIGDPNADWVSHAGELEVRDRTGSVVTADGRLMAQLKGRILDGPEYFSVFDGGTGRVLDSARYIPQRAPGDDSPSVEEMKALWGDGYGNRSERYLAGVAYLDGERPSAIMARGYYGRSVIAAYDFRDGKISTRWVFDSSAPGVPPHFGGQGNHQLSVADIDADGFDEIVYGAMAIDHDGSPKWTTKLGHGDAMHVSDLDPANPGLEMFGVYEDIRRNGGVGSAMINLSDGRILWSKPAQKDNGRGLAADIDPRHLGAENWAHNSDELFNVKGESIAPVRPKQVNFAIWWDGDVLRELLDGSTISKWDWNNNAVNPLLVAEGTLSNNGTKSNPALSGDILGDWREELVLRAEDNRSLRIYSTNIPSEHGLTTLMHDPQYRVSVAWQNTSYNQPPHPSFYLGEKAENPGK
jgi:rhamnogalacturonan endolyase